MHWLSFSSSFLPISSSNGEKVIDLLPLNSRRERTPFVSAGDDLGERTTVCERTSALSGRMVVDDVKTGKNTFRRMFYLFPSFYSLINNCFRRPRFLIKSTSDPIRSPPPPPKQKHRLPLPHLRIPPTHGRRPLTPLPTHPHSHHTATSSAPQITLDRPWRGRVSNVFTPTFPVA